MDCIRVSQNLYDYLDGEIGRLQRAAVTRHLDGCAVCSGGFRFEVQLRQTLWASCQEQPPPGLQQRILDSLTNAARHSLEPTDRGGSSPASGSFPDPI